ncbi:imidazolonepropionase [Streptomyces sp. YIM 130001]|uniref:metal-dependent hydrolase family protein n=1 Tax=Streptomyces sp. YIM 130001 TaxID=2259644 RepID=UPI000E6598A1|nr:amidohydrolase family protein [Streptomyces sp. YIM 130001]RII20654.1 imidazolonepropionase [Streptomyces sp. YIM 130001]
MWLAGATLVDGTGAEPRKVAVRVEDGRITGLEQAPAAGAEVVDCGGLTLTPGLIDAHAHLGLSSDVSDGFRHELSVARIAADIFANCAQTLDGGFTTVREPGGLDDGVAQVVADGIVPGPRILHSGPAHCQTGGHGHLGGFWEAAERWNDHGIPGLRTLSILSDGPDELRKHVRESFRRGASFLKLCVTGGVVSLHDNVSDTQFSRAEIAVAVEEAAARGTYVTVHAHNNAGIRNAVAAGVRCVEHGSGIDEATAALMAAHDVAHVPTLAVVQALLDDTASAGLPPEVADRAASVQQGQIDAIRASRAAGVRVGSGSDLIGPHQEHRGNELVLRSEVESPMEALMAATSVNAGILGIGDEVGTVEVGKRADLVAFAGNPLDDPALFDRRERIVLVIKNGEVVKDIR